MLLQAERNQILLELIVNAVVQIVFHLPDIIVMHLLVFVVLYHRALRKMVLQPTLLPVSVDQQNVLQLVRIAINLLICVVQ